MKRKTGKETRKTRGESTQTEQRSVGEKAYLGQGGTGCDTFPKGTGVGKIQTEHVFKYALKILGKLPFQKKKLIKKNLVKTLLWCRETLPHKSPFKVTAHPSRCNEASGPLAFLTMLFKRSQTSP